MSTDAQAPTMSDMQALAYGYGLRLQAEHECYVVRSLVGAHLYGSSSLEMVGQWLKQFGEKHAS